MNTLEELYISLLEVKGADEGFEEVSKKLDTFINYVDKKKIQKIRSRLDTVRKSQYRVKRGISKSREKFNGKKSYLTGKLFENLIGTLFDDSKMFSYVKNKKTNSAEFDLIITVHDPYRKNFEIFESISRMAAECKCYMSTPEAPWVNKLAGVLNVHKTTVGLIFVYWSKAVAPTAFNEAIHKQYHKGMTRFTMLPFGIAQLEEIINGRSFVNVLEQQLNNLEMELPFHL